MRAYHPPPAYLYNTGVCKTEKYNGVSWYVQTVKNLLSRQVYIGHMVQGRKRQSFYENRGSVRSHERNGSSWKIPTSR